MKLKVRKTTLTLSYPLACVTAAVLILDTSGKVLLCFCAALMHEGGHLFALRCCHTPPEEIKLSLFDAAIIDRKKQLHPFSHELAITLSGIAVNFLSASVGWVLYSIHPHPLLKVFIAAHLTLGIFNALPVDSLDGGQALLLILERFFPPDRAERILLLLSVLILLPTAIIGFWLLLVTKYNFTLLLSALYLTSLLLLKPRKPHRKTSAKRPQIPVS